MNAVNLTTLHATIKSQIESQFPAVQTVEAYGRPGEKISTPAILFELTGIDPDNPSDIGTEQLVVILRFSTYVVFAKETPGYLIEARSLAASLMAFINKKKFGQQIMPAQIVNCEPDDFSPEIETYYTMRIDWTHTAVLGADVWIGTDILPVDIYLSYAPYIGIPYEPIYQKVTNLPDPI